MASRNRLHNEWFRTVSLGGRKSCPCCRTKLESGEEIWSWGEYIIGKWRTVKHFCKSCFQQEVAEPLIRHKDDCGCRIELVVRGIKPEWMSLTNKCEVNHV